MSKTDAIGRCVLDTFARSDGALFFFDEQYELLRVGGQGLIAKTLQPSQASSAFAMQPVDSGWLPRRELRVMRWGTGSKGAWMVGYREPGVYKVVIDTGGKPRTLRVPMPAFVWVGQRHNYFIVAMKGGKFNPKAELYHAPLPNVDSSGLICFGKNPHPDVAKGGFEVSWRTFWDAPFNDHQDDGKSRAHRDTVLEQLREVARSKEKTYPSEDLVKFGSTLGQVVARLVNRGGAGAAYYGPHDDWMETMGYDPD